jgi:hypothetical protein
MDGPRAWFNVCAMFCWLRGCSSCTAFRAQAQAGTKHVTAHRTGGLRERYFTNSSDIKYACRVSQFRSSRPVANLVVEIALRPASDRANSVSRRRTWPEPRLLKLAHAGGSGFLFEGWVAQVGGDRRRSEPSFGCALPLGSLCQRTPRLALAYTPEKAPDAGASGAGSGSALGLSAVQPRVIRVPSSWGVCSGPKDASFVGMGGCVRAVRARSARRPGTSRALAA